MVSGRAIGFMILESLLGFLFFLLDLDWFPWGFVVDQCYSVSIWASELLVVSVIFLVIKRLRAEVFLHEIAYIKLR